MIDGARLCQLCMLLALKHLDMLFNRGHEYEVPGVRTIIQACYVAAL